MSKLLDLVSESKRLDIDLQEASIDKFDRYRELLKEWNEKINLTALTSDKDIEIKHFIDSMTIFETDYIKDYDRIIDIGTGGGFPGVPIKIVNETVEMTLMDSLNKRIKFLQILVDELELDGVECVHSRAEDLARDEDFRENFDIVVSRAVARLNILCEYCLPFVDVGGYFIALKGPSIEEELNEAKKAINLMGCKIVEVKEVRLPVYDISHTLVVIQKNKKTPAKYPRKPGIPKKSPIK